MKFLKGKLTKRIAVAFLAFVMGLCLYVPTSVQEAKASTTAETAVLAETAGYDDTKAYEVLDIVNQRRAEQGLSELKMDTDLMAAAKIRATEITTKFSHTRPDGTLCFTVSGKVYGENIAYGQKTAEAVMIDWMNSEGHRANILTSDYKSIGISCYLYNGRYYWVQLFGIAEAVEPAVTTYNGVDYSAVYDYDYYINAYADLKAAFGSDKNAALAHFVNCGMAEGRQACESFNVTSYAYQYADLRNAYKNDLKQYYLHYINYGKNEGRTATGTTTMQNCATIYNGVDYSAVYDGTYYQTKYADIKAAFGFDDVAMLQHFATYGMKEGRQGCESFDVISYYNQYVDLRNTYGDILIMYYWHYMICGKQEGRVATGCTSRQGKVTAYYGIDHSAVYDYDYYINAYPDLKAAFGDDDVAAMVHFVQYGIKEGRQASADFNVYNYRARYDDLRARYGSALVSYYVHYMKYGLAEGRNAK